MIKSSKNFMSVNFVNNISAIILIYTLMKFYLKEFEKLCNYLFKIEPMERHHFASINIYLFILNKYLAFIKHNGIRDKLMLLEIKF